MGQVSWRVDDALLDRVRQSAKAAGLSVNAYISRVMGVATSEDADGSAAERLRQRLVAAGLLDGRPEPGSVGRPDDADLMAAGEEAAAGTSLSEVVIADRG